MARIPFNTIPSARLSIPGGGENTALSAARAMSSVRFSTGVIPHAPNVKLALEEEKRRGYWRDAKDVAGKASAVGNAIGAYAGAREKYVAQRIETETNDLLTKFQTMLNRGRLGYVDDETGARHESWLSAPYIPGQDVEGKDDKGPVTAATDAINNWWKTAGKGVDFRVQDMFKQRSLSMSERALGEAVATETSAREKHRVEKAMALSNSYADSYVGMPTPDMNDLDNAA